ncbi:hypothetical protein Mgra_00000093 [Meloidogyne graminicola]|uniref:Uncharacterized protein n=1 Tax=Meloidogyne graminicola TaxID=189291 RepID=A0A8T0A4H4_9BILA|nr:hypothetical protein Mgra_00000093 [Meloidogyne graminicola]
MVYVNSVRNCPEFSIVKTFWNFVYFVTFFFRALLGPFFGDSQTDPDAQSRYRSNLRGGGGGSNGFGGGGGGGGGGWRPGGGGGPRRPMGRLNLDGHSSMPSCPMGGCCVIVNIRTEIPGTYIPTETEFLNLVKNIIRIGNLICLKETNQK